MHSEECEAEVGEDALSSCCQHEFTTRKDVILCQGKNKDGTQCKAEIQKKSKVCQKCGTNDDPQWFSSTVITCQGQRKDELISGNIQYKEEEFCIKCGAQWPTELKDPAAKTETEIHPAKTCVKGEGSPMDTNSDNNYFREKSISKLGDQGYLLFHFHVLVSPDFKLNWEKHKVRMQMFILDPESLHCRIFCMKHVRHVQGYEEMQICIKIEKHIVFGTGFNYQYARYNEKKGRLKWEMYTSGLFAASYRYCHLLDKWKDKSEYHQYDGIMNRYGRVGWDYITNKSKSNYMKKLEEDAGTSAEIFTQDILLSTENMAATLDPDTLNMLEMLLLGLENRYLQHAKCWSSQEGFREKMTTAMLPHILKSLEFETETPLFNYTETQQQAERRMQVALFVLSVIGRFKLLLSPHNKSLLARSLLLRPHHETGTFHDLAIVVEKSQKEKRELQAYIIELCSSFQMNDKDPSWLCCIPLLHLLSGDVKSDGTPADDIRHDAQEPHWWGIQSVKSAAEKFKQCSKIWMIDLQDIIKCLSPLFEVDYFLPRTLMSVLQLSEVEKVIETKRIPPEVCIATCSHYIKETRSHNHTSSVTENEQIISCTKMLKEFLAKFEAPRRWSDSLLLRHASLTVRIAEDMVRITFERIFQREHNLLREVVQVFLEAMALYDTTQERLQNDESKDIQNQMLKNLHIRVKKWLIENYGNLLSDSTKRWQDMLCSKTFRSPVVAGMWNAFIVDDFKKQWENENLHNMMQLVISSKVAKKENALQQLQDHQILVAGTGEQGMDIVDRFSTACMEFKTEVAEDVLNSIKITYGQKGIDSLISSLKQLAKVDTCDERVFVLCDSKHAEDVQKCVISHYSRAEKERTSPEEATKKYLIHGRNDNLKEWLEFREVEQAVQSMKNWYQEEFTLSPEEQPKADEVVAMVKNELPAVFIKQTKERIAVFSDNEGNIERAKYKVNMALGRIKITGRRRKHANPQTYDKSFSDTHMSKDDQMDAGLIFPSSSFQSMQQTVDLTAKSYCTKEGLTAKVYFGDLTSLPVDCIVNAANELLSHEGGVALAISKAAGRDFDQEGKEYVKKHGALPVTQCCVTSSGRLPYKVVIHAVGPRWSDYKYNEKERCTEDLKKTIVNCLIEANKFKMASIATPSLSSGIFGVPKALCAQMYAQAVVEYSMTYGLQSVKEIHFVDIIPDMCQLTQSAFDAEFQCS